MNITKVKKGDILGRIENSRLIYGGVLAIDTEKQSIVINTKEEGMKEFDASQLQPLPAIIIDQIKTIKRLKNELRETCQGKDQSLKLLLAACRKSNDSELLPYLRAISEKEKLDQKLIEEGLTKLGKALTNPENPEIRERVKNIILGELERRVRKERRRG